MAMENEPNGDVSQTSKTQSKRIQKRPQLSNLSLLSATILE